MVGVAEIQASYSIIIFAGTAALKRKQSTSVNKLYWYTSVSMIVQVESVMGQRSARGALIIAAYYGRPLSVSGRPCYILTMFLFIYFFMAALFPGPG